MRTLDSRWAPTVLRTHVGLAFLLHHGWHKVTGLARGDTVFVAAVEALGFPAPTLFAWLAAVTQLGAGALLLAGAWARPAALAITGTMLVALAETLPHGYVAAEPALVYALLGAVLTATGPGRLALHRPAFRVTERR